MIINYCELDLFVKFDYEDVEKENGEFLGRPDRAIIKSVILNKTEIYKLLGLRQLFEIQELICKNMRIYKQQEKQAEDAALKMRYE